jgi:O-methyltransferase
LGSITTKSIWLYDSFQGLPNKSSQDIVDETFFAQGTLRASLNNLYDNFSAAGLIRPRVVEAWFKDIKEAQLPNQIAFAHIDGDFFASVRDALQLIYSRLTPKAICVIDDYAHPGLQGVLPAVDEFMCDKPERMIIPKGLFGQNSLHCYFTKI